MSLLVWLPLNGDTKNNGDLFDGELSSTGTISFEDSPFGKSIKVGEGVAFKNGLSFKLSDTFSITCWLKIDEFKGAFLNMFTLVDDTEHWCGVGNSNVSGGLGWHLRNLDNTYITDNYAFSNKFEYGRWFHVALVLNGSSVKQYLNGELISTSFVRNPFDNITYTKIVLGSKYDRMNSVNTGYLSDFRLYDTALTAKEVKEIARGLSVHVPFDWGGQPNVLSEETVATNSTIYDDVACRDVYFSQTEASTECYVYGGRSNVIEPSTTYTFSAWVWVNENVSNVDIYWLSTNATNNKTGIGYDYAIKRVVGLTPVPNKWNLLKWTFETNNDDYTGYIRIDNNGSKNSAMAILKAHSIKLEKGDKVTPYIPNINSNAYTRYGFDVMPYQDCSGNNIILTKSGSLFCDTDTKKGITSTRFNQAGYLYNNSFGRYFQKLSIALWIKNGEMTRDQHFLFGSFNSWPSNGVGIWRDNVRPLIYSVLFNTEGDSDYYSILTPEFPIGEWCHYAITWDGITIKQYLNGSLFDTNTYGDNGIIYMPTLYIGNSLFDGASERESDECSVSDFRLYASTLSADDVKTLYKFPVSVDKEGNIFCNQLMEEEYINKHTLTVNITDNYWESLRLNGVDLPCLYGTYNYEYYEGTKILYDCVTQGRGYSGVIIMNSDVSFNEELGLS